MKKYAIPVIIIIIAIIFTALYFLTPLHINDFPNFLKIIFFILFVCITGALIGVLVQRIKEIKEENPDDYRKY